jgi:threonine aldolase
MGAEAVVTFRPELKSAFRFLQKQAMQTPSKMRFVACQIEALFMNNLWQKNASKVPKKKSHFRNLAVYQPNE